MTKLATAVGLVLLTVPAYAAEHSEADAQKAVTAFVGHYANLYNSKNAKGIADLFMDDGVEVPPAQMVTGRDNIEKWFESVFAHGAKDLKYEVKQVEPMGNYVLAVGQFTVTLPQPSGTGEHTVPGNFVNVYEWVGDDLKYRVHSSNLIPPPPK